VAQRVDVVRVKNRNELLPATPPTTPSPPGDRPLAPLRPAPHESRELKLASGGLGSGYRDVAVNLRVVAGAGVALGLSGHVCEVQLLLEGFARVKSDDGHRRYVEWRNFRGE
jgi:hypothetical protein